MVTMVRLLYNQVPHIQPIYNFIVVVVVEVLGKQQQLVVARQVFLMLVMVWNITSQMVQLQFLMLVVVLEVGVLPLVIVQKNLAVVV